MATRIGPNAPGIQVCIFYWGIGDALYLSTFETLAATVTAVVRVVDLQTATCRCSSISSWWLNLRIFARSRATPRKME